MMRDATTVLLIDDDSGEADLVRALLGRVDHAYELEHAERLESGIERLARAEIDVVVLDLGLPDSRGLVTYERFGERVPPVPVVVLTNLDDEETAMEAVRLGAQDYLVKREIDEHLLDRALRYAIERHRADEALRVSRERYALAVEAAHDGIWDWDRATGDVYFSSRWKSIVAPGAEETIGASIDDWLDHVLDDDRPRVDAALQAHVDGADETLEIEHRLGEGEMPTWVVARATSVRGDDGRAVRVVGSLTDVTARKRVEEQLLHDALHDALTGLPNRTLFRDRLSQALRHARGRRKTPFAVLYLDLDRFKIVNDTYGHRIGDELLTAVADRLQGFLRPADTLARLGGDEFAVLLDDIEDVGAATHVCSRIQELLQAPFDLDEHEVFTSAAVGIAMSTSGYERADDMLRDADIALYRAKASGHGHFEVFDRRMHERMATLLRLENELRQAVEREEFVMHYQPIVSLSSGRIVGFEALVRWRHPRRGIMRPAQFLAVAEETGLIVPLGLWVIEASSRQIREWQRRFEFEPPLSVSVNVSGRVLRERDIVERLTEVLERTGLPPGSLQLEITENVLLDDDAHMTECLGELRALGIGLHIDDFGTGYSSLTYLQRFRYDTLKIDRSFVNDLSAAEGSGAIVRALVSLGDLLGMNVIAEGVETDDQLRRLRDLGCPEGQGYCFAAPVDPPAAERLLASGATW